jgi:hypothetical protein
VSYVGGRAELAAQNQKLQESHMIEGSEASVAGSEFLRRCLLRSEVFRLQTSFVYFAEKDFLASCNKETLQIYCLLEPCTCGSCVSLVDVWSDEMQECLHPCHFERELFRQIPIKFCHLKTPQEQIQRNTPGPAFCLCSIVLLAKSDISGASIGRPHKQV